MVPSVAYSTEEIEGLTSRLQIMQLNSAVLCELLRSNNLFGIGPKLCKLLEDDSASLVEEDLIIVLYLLLQHGTNNADEKELLVSNLLTLAYTLCTSSTLSETRLRKLAELLEARSSNFLLAEFIETRKKESALTEIMDQPARLQVWTSLTKSFANNDAVKKLDLLSSFQEFFVGWLLEFVPTTFDCKSTLLMLYYMLSDDVIGPCNFTALSHNESCVQFMRQAYAAVKPTDTPVDIFDLEQLCSRPLQREIEIEYVHRLCTHLNAIDCTSNDKVKRRLKEFFTQMLDCTWTYAQLPPSNILEHSASKIVLVSPTIKRQWVRAENAIYRAYFSALDVFVNQVMEPLVTSLYGKFSGEQVARLDTIKSKCLGALVETMKKSDTPTKIELTKVIFYFFKLIKSLAVKLEVFEDLVKQLPQIVPGKVRYICEEETFSLHLYASDVSEQSESFITKPKAKQKGGSLNCSLSTINYQ